MKISIIIPTLNEEKYLPQLLADIKKQNFKDYEIIVADANSKDKTKEIAKKHGAIIVKGGLPGPGRNAGAKIAKGEFLFFLDADVRLPRNFLKNAYSEIQNRFLDLATCEFIPISDLNMDRIIHNIANMFIKLNQSNNPHAGGFCILVSKRLFNRVNGFNEKLRMAEDHDFVKRAAQFRSFRVLFSTKIKVSVRRLEKEGRIGISQKYLYTEAYRFFYGNIEKDIVQYEFAEFDKHDTPKFEKKLIDLDKKLNTINAEFNKRVKNKLNGRTINLSLAKYFLKVENQYKQTIKWLTNLTN